MQLQNAVAVGSVTPLNEIASYTTMSKKVEFLAPDYALSYAWDGVIPGSGTSVATPIVAGSYAILKSAFPTLSPNQILQTMKVTGDPVDDAFVPGKPKINVGKAFSALKAGNIPVIPKETETGEESKQSTSILFAKVFNCSIAAGR